MTFRSIFQFPLLFALPLFAAPDFSDNFSSLPGANYTLSGNAPGSSLGTNLSYNGLQSSGSSLIFSTFETSSLDARARAINDPDFSTRFLNNSDSVYFSALLQVPDLSSFGEAGGSLYVGFGNSGSNAYSYGLGLAVDGSGTIQFAADTGNGTQMLGGTVNEGETVMVVGRISGWPDSSGFAPPSSFEYLLNPVISAAEPLSWNSVTATGNSNRVSADSSFVEVNAFSNSWNADNNASFLIDEHRIGSRWEDVAPQAIPEPGSLWLGLLGAGSVLLLRKRLKNAA